MICCQSVHDNCRVIVLTYHKFCTALIAGLVILGRIINDVIRRAACLAKTSACHSLNNFFIGNFDGKNGIDLNAHSVESLCLRNGTGESVKDETVCTVRLCKALLDNANHGGIGYECAAFCIALCLKTHLCLIRNCVADHCAGGDRGDIQSFTYYFSLRTFAGSGRAKENNIHKIHLNTF